MNINKLVSIVQKKNDLNRRRRRFFYHMTRPKGLSHKDQLFYLNGYIKAQTAMKKMTKGMRKACKEIGAEFSWNNGGMIVVITCGELCIPHAEYKRYVDAHAIESILLKGDK